MKTNWVIEVTETDAMEGVRKNAHFCAIQVALERAMRNTTSHITVDRQTIRWTAEDEGVRKRVVYLTPAPAQQYLQDFDDGLPFRPFTLRLSDPRIAVVPQRDPNAAKRVSMRPAAQVKYTKLSTRVFGIRKVQRTTKADAAPAISDSKRGGV